MFVECMMTEGRWVAVNGSQGVENEGNDKEMGLEIPECSHIFPWSQQGCTGPLLEQFSVKSFYMHDFT